MRHSGFTRQRVDVTPVGQLGELDTLYIRLKDRTVVGRIKQNSLLFLMNPATGHRMYFSLEHLAGIMGGGLAKNVSEERKMKT